MTEREKELLKLLERCATEFAEISYYISSAVSSPLSVAPQKLRSLADFVYSLNESYMNKVLDFKEDVKNE